MCPGEQAPSLREPGVVAALLEDRHRLGDRLCRLLAPALGLARSELTRSCTRHACAATRGRSRLVRDSDGVLKGYSGLLEARRPGGAPRRSPAGARACRSRRRAAAATARPRRFAAAGTSPRANARRPAEARRRGPVSAERAAVVVERAELGRGSDAPARGGSRGSPRTPSRASRFTPSAHSTNRSWRSARARLRMPSYAVSRMRTWWKRNASSSERDVVAAGRAASPSASPAARRARGARARVRGGARRRATKSWPITDAGSITARSSSSRRSSRAARRAWIVGGTATSRDRPRLARQRRPRSGSAPSSMSMESSCSTKSGLPSAAATMRSRMSLVELGHPRGGARRPPLPRPRSGARAEPGRARARRPAPAVRSRSSCRAVQTTTSWRVRRVLDDVLDQLEERRLGPVDVVEETTSGCSRRERTRAACRAPQTSSWTGNGRRREPDRGRDALGDLGVARESRRASPAPPPVVSRSAIPRRLAHGLGERPEGDAVAVREAAAAEDPDASSVDRAR